MKKIGFVDFYMSEWHANNYPNWIRELDRGYEVSYAWAEQDVSPRDGVTTDEWCAKFGAERCKTIEELCEKSDAIVILAPTDPDKHLVYAERVLPFGKPTYIDKTFAPNAAEAEKIVSLARRFGTPCFSTSALRYASELQLIENPCAMSVTAGGKLLSEYLIHAVEMVVCTLGGDAAWVRAEGQEGQSVSWHIAYADGRYATVVFASCLPFPLYLSNGSAEKYVPVKSSFFMSLMNDMLDLFDGGAPAVPFEETLAVMRLRDAMLSAKDRMGERVELA